MMVELTPEQIRTLRVLVYVRKEFCEENLDTFGGEYRRERDEMKELQDALPSIGEVQAAEQRARS